MMLGIWMMVRISVTVTREMIGNRSVGGEGPWLGLEKVLIYLGTGGEVVVMLMLTEASVVGLRRYPELHSWLEIQKDHLNESSSRFLRPENTSLYCQALTLLCIGCIAEQQRACQSVYPSNNQLDPR